MEAIKRYKFKQLLKKSHQTLFFNQNANILFLSLK